MHRSTTETAKAISEARGNAEAEIAAMQAKLRSLQESLKSDPLAAAATSAEIAEHSRRLAGNAILNARDRYSLQEIGDEMGMTKQGVAHRIDQHFELEARAEEPRRPGGLEL